MNTIISNSLYACRSAQQADRQKHARSRNVNLESTVERFYGDIGTVNTKDSDISVQEAYERLGGYLRHYRKQSRMKNTWISPLKRVT